MTGEGDRLRRAGAGVWSRYGAVWGMFTRSSLRRLVVPSFDLICDVSASMTGAMAELHSGLQALRRTIVSSPVVDDVAQICIMSGARQGDVSAAGRDSWRRPVLALLRREQRRKA